ncbi:hypothetical protein ACFQV8_36225 [Pseudonocardia benzenivorans]
MARDVLDPRPVPRPALRRALPTEHVRDVLDRLRGDTTNAVVTLDEERALADAAARTEELGRGEWRGRCTGSRSG